MSELAKALHAFQKDAPSIPLDSTNPHYHSRFASLSGVVAAVRTGLAEHGLSFSQLPSHIDHLPALRTRLTHTSGEWLEDTTPLILSKQDMQAYGSAMTYARRYALLSILGLVGDEDDDANAATPQGSAGSAGVSASPVETPGGAASPGETPAGGATTCRPIRCWTGCARPLRRRRPR